jgi:hypothetical protein
VDLYAPCQLIPLEEDNVLIAVCPESVQRELDGCRVCWHAAFVSNLHVLSDHRQAPLACLPHACVCSLVDLLITKSGYIKPTRYAVGHPE